MMWCEGCSEEALQGKVNYSPSDVTGQGPAVFKAPHRRLHGIPVHSHIELQMSDLHLITLLMDNCNQSKSPVSENKGYSENVLRASGMILGRLPFAPNQCEILQTHIHTETCHCI